MTGIFHELIRHRELLYMITMRELKVKYKQSIMGILWALLMPGIVVLAGIFIRIGLSSASGKTIATQEILSVSVKAIPWAFFISAVRFATNSLVANTSLVTKIYMPREIFPFASVLSQLVDATVATAVLVIVVGVLGIGASLHLLWVPLLIIPLILFTIALGMLFSAANLFFRDVKYIVEAVLTFAIFFTPVFYDAQNLGEWSSVVMLNPIAPVLEGLSQSVVYHQAPQMVWLVYSLGVSAVTLVAALTFFRKLEPFFAEYI
jgi:lipopolysaccharide transport system permease protein